MAAAGIIVVGGISGVGKTTLCRNLAAVEPGVSHLMASTFVEGASAQTDLASRIRAEAIARGGASLVDGHLIIDGNRVPLEAVAELRPRGIVVVTGDPQDIVARRALDSVRARPAVTKDEVDHAQQAEIDWAQEVARALAVPFTTAENTEQVKFRSKVLHLLGTG